MARDDEVIGIKTEFDVGDLKAGLQEVTKSIKSANSEFKNSTSDMERWSKSSDGLKAKLKQLNTQLDGQKKSVELYQKEIERVSKLEGDHSAELEILKGKLQTAENAVKKTEQSINKFSSSMAKVTAEEKLANSEYGKLTATIKEQQSQLSGLESEYKQAVTQYGKNSREAKDLAKQIKDLNKDLDDNQDAVDKADDAYKDLSKSTKTASETMAELGETADKGLSILGGIGKTIGGAIAGLGASFIASAEGTKEYRTQMAKLDSAFEASGHEAKLAEQTYYDLYAVLGDSGKASEASMQLAKLADNEKDLNSLTRILTGVYATFGDSLPVEGLAEAMNHTAKLGSVQGNLADALEWSGINVDDFNEQLEKLNTEEERSELIQKTLTDLYGDTAKSYKENNKELIASNEAQNTLNETMARVGELAEPIVTQFKQMGAEIAERLLPVIEELAPKMLELSKTIGDYIEPVLTFFIGTALPFLIDNLPTIITLVGTLTAGFGALKVAQIAMNVAMNANPIGLIITAIGLLVTAFVTLWTKSEAFRNFFINMWESIKYATGVVILAITTAFYESVDAIKNAWATVSTFFSDLWTGIKDTFSGIKTWFSDKFTEAWEGIKTAWNSVTTFFSDIVTGIKDTFTSLPDDMLNIGKDLVTGLWNGIKDMTSWITGKLKTFTDDVLAGIKKFFGIKSPSKETGKIGEYLAEGLGNGIAKGTKGVVKVAKKQADDVINGFRDAFGVHSASKETTEIGEYLAEGLSDGLQNGEKGVENSVDKMFNSLSDRLGADSNLVSTIGNLLGKNIGEAVTDGVNESVSENVIPVIGNAIPDFNVSVQVDEKGLSKSLTKNEKILDKWEKGIEKKFEDVGKSGEKITSVVMDMANSFVRLSDQLVKNQLDELDAEYKKFAKTKDEELAKFTSTIDAELVKLQTLHEQGKINDAEYEERKKQLETNLFDFSQQIELEKKKAEEETLKKKNELAEKQFKAQQATNIAQAIINGATAITKGFAELGPVGGAVNAVAQGLITGAQVATIASQKFVPFAETGGIVDHATLAMIGENGKEAIMPLEKNTGWIRDLASQIYGFGGGFQPSYAGSGATTNNFYQTINAPKTPSRLELYRDTKNLLAFKGR